MSYDESQISIEDFKKYQADIQFVKRRTEILKKTPEIKRRQIVAANRSALTIILADNRQELQARQFETKELKKEL
jgi:hypothetical protein